MAPQDDAFFAVGDAVQLVDMPAALGLEGAVGTLLKPVGAGRWAVKLECDDRSRVLAVENLQRRAAQEPGEPADLGQVDGHAAEPPAKYSIVGTWDDWAPAAMSWNAELQCLEASMVVEEGECESFKFILDDDWDRCIYPDQKDATPQRPHCILGPDDGGLEEEWTIGASSEDDLTPGTSYAILLFLTPSGTPLRVAWEVAQRAKVQSAARLQAAAESPESAPAREQGLPSTEAPRGVQSAFIEQERLARERLARRLEAAERRRPPQEEEEEAEAVARGFGGRQGEVVMYSFEQDDRRQQVKENRERYRESMRDNRGASNSITVTKSQASKSGVCVECGCSTLNMMGKAFSCEACWEEWAALRRRGWDATVLCDGVAAGLRAERLAEDGTFSRAMAREYLLRQHAAKFE